MIPCNSYYGGFRTRTFSDIFSNAEEFAEAADNVGIPLKITNLDTLFYLLYARYGNSHIAFSDETQFVYSVFSTIFQYGPTWEKRLDIQDKLRALEYDHSDKGIFRGTKAIHNHSYNPSSEPSTSSLEELRTINEQNATTYVKSPVEGYAMLLDLLDTDVTEEFITKFRKLFIQVLAPDYPLLYTTEVE